MVSRSSGDRMASKRSTAAVIVSGHARFLALESYTIANFPSCEHIPLLEPTTHR